MPVIKTLKNGVWVPVNSVTDISTATTTTAGLMSATDKVKLNDIIDYPIEIGTDGIWTYEKWASGKAVCYGSVTETNVAMTSAEGYGYYCPAKSYSYPTGLFIEDPVLSPIPQGQSRLVSFGLSVNNKNTFAGYYWCTISVTMTVYCHFYAVGKWK